MLKPISARRAVMVAAFAVLAALAAVPAHAQMGDHRWLLGVDLAANTVGDNDEADDVDGIIIDGNAGGLGLQLGYLLKPSFMLRLTAFGADHKTSDPDVKIRFGGGSLDAVFLFRAGQPFRPYLFAGLGGYQAQSQQDDLTYDIRGPGVALGAGMHLRLGSRATLHGSLRVESINWEEARVTWDGPGGTVEVAAPIDEEGWASQVMLGLGLWL